MCGFASCLRTRVLPTALHALKAYNTTRLSLAPPMPKKPPYRSYHLNTLFTSSILPILCLALLSTITYAGFVASSARRDAAHDIAVNLCSYMSHPQPPAAALAAGLSQLC